MICLTIMILNIGFRLFECQRILQSTQSSNKTWTAPPLFMVFHGYLNILFQCTVWQSVWKHKSFLKLFLFINQNKFFHHECQTRVRFILPIVVWIFINSVAFVRTIESSNEEKMLSNLLTNPTLCTVIFKVLCYVRHLVGFFEEIFILVMVIPLWFFPRNFLKAIKQVRYPWEFLKQQYIAIRGLFDVVNDIIWPNVFIHTVENFVYYSFNLDMFMTSSDFSRGMQFLIYFVNGCVFYYLAADLCDKVSIWYTIGSNI